MAAAKKHECLHEGCKLPRNNYRFLWQWAYIILGLSILLLKNEAFTFFQVFLFVFPIFIDIAYNDLDSKILDAVRLFFGILNVLVMSICVFGMAGIMIDNGSVFVMDLAVIGVCIEVHKSTVAFLMAPNLIVPLIYFCTSPCQRGADTTAFFRDHSRKAEVK